MQNKKIIVVTGGSKGIGNEIIKKFINDDVKIFFTYRKKNTFVSKIKKSKLTQIIPIKCDMSKLENLKIIKSIISKEKKIDVLINNVGDVKKRSSFIKSSDQLWVDNLTINLMSAVSLTRLLLKKLNKSENSVIINISSIASKTGGGGDSLHYGVSKGALNVFTKGLAKELSKNIRVIGIAPSAINTSFQKKYSSNTRIKNIIKQTPMKRLGLSSEIAELIYFICSNKTSYISGETIFVTGGR